MTSFQMIALAVLAAVAVAQFVLPNMPTLTKPNSLKHIAQVIAIRDSSTDPKVVEACKALLQVLL
jgi:hypothetical protein